ncbi:MAG: sensor histidine kinase [Terriglobia bacterium]
MFQRRHSSITAKLTWMNMLITATALLLSSAAFALYLVMALRQSAVRGLSIQSQIVGLNSVSALLFNDRRSAQTTLAALSASPQILSARIFTPDGKPFADYVRGRRALPAMPAMPIAHTRDEAESHRFGRKDLLLARRIDFQGKPLGFVIIRSDLAEIRGLEANYALITVVVLAGCLVAAFVLSSFFQRAVARPVVRLAEIARIISRQKNYSIRIAPGERRDEVGVLMSSFNDMLAEIQQRDAALQRAHNELERRVEERTAQLEAVNKELEAFSYSVSHDLRAPLRQVNGFAKILADDAGPRLDPAAQRYLKLIQDGARNMGELIDDLINMGRIGRLEPAFRPVDLSVALRSALDDLKPDLAGRRIDWRIAALPVVECDPGLIKLVFANLLSNAVKYTRIREDAVIEVDSHKAEGESVISVRDNGAGFDPKYAHKLFGVFQRLHRQEEFEGTGVGLATARRIIQKHGGRIWAEGEAGRGATFFFTLRTNRAEDHAGGHSAASEVSDAKRTY